jgi:hypothetical protein
MDEAFATALTDTRRGKDNVAALGVLSENGIARLA